MATTWQKAIHRSSSGSISAALTRTIEYAENPEKTQGGELIAAYECDLFTAQSEFMLSKKLYEQKTGRNQGKHDVIGYQIRQSFKLGEVTAAEALKIGYDLALRWTKGKHQFIVAAHTNTNNPHTHIFFNSVTLDHSRKFEDFKRSAIALRRVSDQICLENCLSVIENPALSKGQNRTEYLGEHKPPSNRKRLEQMIDSVLCECKDFDGFIAAMIKAGCTVNHGKHIAIKIPSAKKNIRLDSLGDDYSETAIMERLSGTRIVASKPKIVTHTPTGNEPNLLIDIQSKISEGKGGGYEQWAKIFNLKQSAKTLMFLQEQGINSYEELCEKSSAVSAEFSRKNVRIKEIESRLKDISDLQKQIGIYGKTKEKYKVYISSGKDESLYNEYVSDIILHKAAKKYFDGLGLKKLPKMADLKQEYATLAAEKKKLYSDYHYLKQKSRDLTTAKMNADTLLHGTRQPQKSHEHTM